MRRRPDSAANFSFMSLPVCLDSVPTHILERQYGLLFVLLDQSRVAEMESPAEHPASNARRSRVMKHYLAEDQKAEKETARDAITAPYDWTPPCRGSATIT
jgi:hypothetical protein